MSMQRKLKRSIWRLNIICQTYSQVATTQPLTYNYMVRIRLQQHYKTLALSLPGNGILARTDDGQTH